MPAAPFDELESDLETGGAEAALERLATRFRDEGDYHSLFDTRLMQARRRLGLPIILTTPLEELEEPLRGEVERAYLDACREAGWQLWKSGKFREAWMYLRPLGENGAVADAISQVDVNEENLASLVEIALREGVAPAYGFELVLRQYGVCNAITAFDSEIGQHRRGQQQIAAGLLIRQLHTDLLANVQADIARREEGAPCEGKLTELLAGRDSLFADDNYHIDTSHLSATVRIARIVEEPEILRLAWELTEYGRRLSAIFQLTGDEPFEDVYRSHGLFFAAQLGRDIEEAQAYFRDKADHANPDGAGTAAAEVYVVLLIRLRRFADALEEHIRLMPAGVRTTGFAPTVLELARLSGNYNRLLAVCRERGDLLGFAAGLLEMKPGITSTPN